MIKAFSVLTFVFFLSFSNAQAFSAKSFEKDSFKQAQKQGKTILIDVYADWCPTCKKQHTDLEALFKTSEFKDVVAFQVDYDDKDLVQTFSQTISRPIPRQSTIVVFKGKELVTFAVAETGDKLKEKIKKGL